MRCTSRFPTRVARSGTLRFSPWGGFRVASLRPPPKLKPSLVQLRQQSQAVGALQSAAVRSLPETQRMDVFMELLLVTHNHRAEEPLTGKQFVDCGRLTSQRHDTLRTNPQSEHRAQGHKEARAIIGAQTYTRGELIRFPYSVYLSLSAFPCSRHRGAVLHICASHALGHGVIPDTTHPPSGPAASF